MDVQVIEDKYIKSPVVCSYCEEEAELTDSSEVYNGRSYGLIWICRSCGAYVGVHKGSERPLGRLANLELRKWKMKVHAILDPIWREAQRDYEMKKYFARNTAYKLLAEGMNIERKYCHIGYFDIDLCRLACQVAARITPLQIHQKYQDSINQPA